MIKNVKNSFVISVFVGLVILSFDANAKTKTIIDASGKEVVIPVNPKRIAIASDREFTEPFIAAGIIPIAVASQHEFPPYLKKEIAKIKNLTDLGNHREIDLEALVAAKPDLIIIRNINTWGDPKLYEEAKKIAPVVQINAMNGIRNLINEIGNIFGKKVSDKLNERIDNAVVKMKNATNDPSKILISHAGISSGDFWVYREDSNMASQLIREAGYARPKSQKARIKGIDNNLDRYSFENISYLDGDILFLNARTFENIDVDKLLKSNIWRTLNVVKNNKVVLSDWRYWNNGGPLAAEAIAEDFVKGLKKAGLAR